MNKAQKNGEVVSQTASQNRKNRNSESNFKIQQELWETVKKDFKNYKSSKISNIFLQKDECEPSNKNLSFLQKPKKSKNEH